MVASRLILAWLQNGGFISKYGKAYLNPLSNFHSENPIPASVGKLNYESFYISPKAVYISRFVIPIRTQTGCAYLLFIDR